MSPTAPTRKLASGGKWRKCKNIVELSFENLVRIYDTWKTNFSHLKGLKRRIVVEIRDPLHATFRRFSFLSATWTLKRDSEGGNRAPRPKRYDAVAPAWAPNLANLHSSELFRHTFCKWPIMYVSRVAWAAHCWHFRLRTNSYSYCSTSPSSSSSFSSSSNTYYSSSCCPTSTPTPALKNSKYKLS